MNIITLIFTATFIVSLKGKPQHTSSDDITKSNQTEELEQLESMEPVNPSSNNPSSDDPQTLPEAIPGMPPPEGPEMPQIEGKNADQNMIALCEGQFERVTQKGKKCVFPFRYKGLNYCKCLPYRFHKGWSWCPYSLGVSGSILAWDYCSASDPAYCNFINPTDCSNTFFKSTCLSKCGVCVSKDFWTGPTCKKRMPVISVEDLYSASKTGDLDAVKTAIASGTNVHWRNQEVHGWTALHAASANNHPDIVRALLDAGALKDALGDGGATPVIAAARHNSTAAITALIDAGANLNAQTREGGTGLMLAAAQGYVNVVKALIAAEADVTVAMQEGRTALHAAAMFNKPEAAWLLLQAGAPILARTKSGKTPSDLARQQGHDALARIIDHFITPITNTGG